MKKPRTPFSLVGERNARIVQAFDTLASMGFQVVHAEEKPKARKPHPPRHDLRISPSEHAALREMAQRAVWQERGGLAVGARTAFEASRGIRTRRDMNEEGAGRTHWVGMPEWARGLSMNREAIETAVEKAIAGECLGARQTRCLKAMLDEIRGTDTSAAPQEKTDCPF